MQTFTSSPHRKKPRNLKSLPKILKKAERNITVHFVLNDMREAHSKIISLSKNYNYTAASKNGKHICSGLKEEHQSIHGVN